MIYGIGLKRCPIRINENYRLHPKCNNLRLVALTQLAGNFPCAAPL